MHVCSTCSHSPLLCSFTTLHVLYSHSLTSPSHLSSVTGENASGGEAAVPFVGGAAHPEPIPPTPQSCLRVCARASERGREGVRE